MRNEIHCDFKPGKALGHGAMMGAANYHCWITFEDGINWLVRVPKVEAFSDDPKDLVDYLVKSEYATLKFLEHLSFPTPKVYGYGLACDPNNLVGVAYLLEDAMPGRTFCVQGATEEQKTHVYEQYVNFLIEVSHHPRAQACSLIPQDGSLKNSAIAGNRFGTLGEYGPFDSIEDYFKCIAELHLGLIADGQLYPEYPKEAFVFYRLMAEVVAPELAKVASPEGFFLKHADDKGDHFLVDDNYNITAVIDWQFARFVPAVEAFGPSLLTADLHGLYSDITGLSADDRYISAALKRSGCEDLAVLAAGNELVRRFHFGLASGATLVEARGMIGAVLELFGNGEMEVQDWIENEWNRDNGDWRMKKVKKLVAKLALE